MAYLIGRDNRPIITPDTLKRRQKDVENNIKDASSMRPAQGGLVEVLARIGQGGLAGYQQHKLDQRAQEGREKSAESFGGLLDSLMGTQGGSTPGMSGPAVQPDLSYSEGITNRDSPNAPVNQLAMSREAIGSIESAGSGDYRAMGPQTKTGDRAYGRYQVMGSNIGPWTREALGREMTPQEFLESDEAQDAVFNHQFGGYIQKYGNAQDAASMWFTGRPASQGKNRKDILGTSGSDYVNKFNAAMGRSSPDPAQKAGGVDTRALVAAMSDPNLSSGQQSLLNTLIGQRLKTPAPTKGVNVNGRLVDPTTGEVMGDFSDPQKPMSVGPGATLVDPATGREVFSAPTKPTTDIQNYEFSRDNPEFAGFAQDMRKSGATQVNVGADGIDYGKPPTDTAWQRDEAGKVVLDERGIPVALPIGGTKGALAAERAQEAKGLLAEKEANTADVVTQDIDRALELINKESLLSPATGFTGDLMSSVGGTRAKNLESLLSTVKANAGFAELQAMRNSSPTGGALGAISERELKFLQSTIGSLEQSQSADQLKENLNRVKKAYQDIIHGPQGETAPAAGGGADALKQKYGLE